MNTKKNKIVFGGIVLTVVLFIGVYTYSMLGAKDEQEVEANRIPVPELEDEQKTYESKLEALDDLKEVRESNAPSIYDERLLDSTGTYDPDLLDKEKMRIVDSIYKHGRITYTEKRRVVSKQRVVREVKKDSSVDVESKQLGVEVKELGLEHQLFFASNPVENDLDSGVDADGSMLVAVHGTQRVKKDYRLQLRLLVEANLNGKHIPANTLIYGFVSFTPNRVMLSISHINHQPVQLKAYDWQDGREGIYIENSFRAEARQEVVEDMVDDINIAGVPQVSGVKRLFQRNNRHVNVTIANNYKLILKR